jgi:hypothetical protein
MFFSHPKLAGYLFQLFIDVRVVPETAKYKKDILCLREIKNQ